MSRSSFVKTLASAVIPATLQAISLMRDNMMGKNEIYIFLFNSKVATNIKYIGGDIAYCEPQ